MNREHVEQVFMRLQLEESQNRSRLRSLIFMDDRIHSDLIKFPVLTLKLKLVRVLVLKIGHLRDFSLPGEIFELIHLRYLYLERFDEINLPTCIENLKNLLTVDIRHSKIRGLENLSRLRGLRHLCLKEIRFIFHPEYTSLRLDQLENVRTLSSVCLNPRMFLEMGSLSRTLHKLKIGDIQRQEELDAVFLWQSTIKLRNLQTLRLDWFVLGDDKVEPQRQHMEALQQCENLWKLHLNGRIQERMDKPLLFPKNLIKLEIWNAKLSATDLMDVLGSSLPFLKFLMLGSHAYEGRELTCREGSFPKLERLEFKALLRLERWTVERGAMPSLKDLSFATCIFLDQPPEGWRFESDLKQVRAAEMSTEFMDSLEKWREHHADLTIVRIPEKDLWSKLRSRLSYR